jgi:oligopeptide/dipeptide ABC transporter ATP-binding protein
MGLLPRPAGVLESGRILVNGQDLAALKPDQLRQFRGRQIGMIFQEPMTALNPVHTIGRQVLETLQVYEPKAEKSSLVKRSLELLEQVGIPAPTQRLKEYPHQLSGGMRQRVMIAMALAGRPRVLIADEPTTALDVTVQAQILELLRSLQSEYGMAMIFITHDLGVVAELCDEVLVMYAGRVAEQAPVQALFDAPNHPYTQALLREVPRLETRRSQFLPIEGEIPSPLEPPSGCHFHPRCPHATRRCRDEQPVLKEVQPGWWSACHLNDG